MNKTADTVAVQPISSRHEQSIRRITGEYIHRAGMLYDRKLALIPVMFDLKGRAAGMYKVRDRNRTIHYNPYIFAKYLDDNIATTVPHEVAHYVVDILYGATNTRPHGVEWRNVMLSLGVEPVVTANYDLSDIPVRRQRRHAYQCACTVHQITTVRHNKIISGKAHYLCRNCMKPLTSAETTE
jgi:SprT protein